MVALVNNTKIFPYTKQVNAGLQFVLHYDLQQFKIIVFDGLRTEQPKYLVEDVKL